MTTQNNEEKKCENCIATPGGVIKSTADLENCIECGRKLSDFPSKPQEEEIEWQARERLKAPPFDTPTFPSGGTIKKSSPSPTDWKDEEREAFGRLIYESSAKGGMSSTDLDGSWTVDNVLVCNYWLSRIQSRIDEAREQGYTEGLNCPVPMGISQWANHGIKYGYNIFFNKTGRQEATAEIVKMIEGMKKNKEKETYCGCDGECFADCPQSFDQALSDLKDKIESHG